MSDVKVPGLGNVPKPALVAVGVASVGILAYAYYRHSLSSGAADTSPSSATTDSTIDPATGVPYADEFGYTNSGYQFQGINDPSTGQIIGTGVGTGVITQASTNAAWAQASQAYLVTYGGFQDASAVAAALGAGLLGHYMTPDQVGIWNSAVAFEGDPPQGHPPLNTTPPIGQPPAPTPGKLAAPSGFRSTKHTRDSATLTWSSVSGALEYHLKITGPAFDHTIITHSTTYTVGNLNRNSTYKFYVMAQNAAGTGKPSSTVSVRTSK